MLTDEQKSKLAAMREQQEAMAREIREAGCAYYRVVTDGDAHRTQIFGPDGKVIKNVRRVHMDIDAGSARVVLNLEIYPDRFEYEGPAEILKWQPGDSSSEE